jgi:hypothetical protein
MAASPDRWQRLERPFYEAVELEPTARKALLDQRYAGDDSLRNHLESPLASANQTVDFGLMPDSRDSASTAREGKGKADEKQGKR